MTNSIPTYKNHRFPIDIVAHAVWLYYRFNLSLREVEEMILERGVVVSYETIRRWCRTHGTEYARRLRRKSPSPSDSWHLDELVVRLNGRKYWLWRAVDEAGHGAEADDHRQAPILWSSQTPAYCLSEPIAKAPTRP